MHHPEEVVRHRCGAQENNQPSALEVVTLVRSNACASLVWRTWASKKSLCRTRVPSTRTPRSFDGINGSPRHTVTDSPLRCCGRARRGMSQRGSTPWLIMNPQFVFEVVVQSGRAEWCLHHVDVIKEGEELHIGPQVSSDGAQGLALLFHPGNFHGLPVRNMMFVLK